MAPLDREQDAWPAWFAQWQEAQRAWGDWWQRTASPPIAAASVPLQHVPVDIAALNVRFQQDLSKLWAAVLTTSIGEPLPEVVEQPASDRRFAAKAWHEQPYFSLLRQSYLLYASYLRELAALAPLPEQDKRRLAFATRQYVDAIAPTNFPATNPDVLRKAVATQGESLVQGLRNLADDARKGRITMTDERAFAVGRNLAVTPGSVVYRNELFELLQYDPTTPKVGRRPIVMVPPCINKYYILDLTPANSFVAHAVAQGHTVFMMSWRNVPPDLGKLTWDDYLEKGVITALRVARDIAGSTSVNALGFCVGGTLLACALAVLAARKEAIVTSATFLTTMLDFADPGDIGVYVSEEFLAARGPAFMSGERIHGSELATAFASLRPNELVWNYFVGNYMKGESPPAFDLLYWNSDSSNLPGPMYVYYLRNLYLDNKLREPGALTMCGVPVDLSRICHSRCTCSRRAKTTSCRGAPRTGRPALVGGDVTFVLAASGHIAGVINPPLARKRNYWRNDL
jgi:polyhydroxyalkanoate synthase